MSFFTELKRRNVFKVAIAYIVMAWLVMQVADVILNNVEAPGWVFHVILLLLGIGLLFSIFFAWAFELTPEGIKRESEVDRSRSITQQTGQKLNFAIIAILVIALGYFAFDKFVLSKDGTQEFISAEAPAERAAGADQDAAKADKSIAVLPFADMSPDRDQDYFSDGLSEELLNLLARVPELQVAARTSSFSFKGQNLEIPEIAERLKVEHVLEGSVRKAGNQLRITAQLIKAEDGYHMWSETYDRTLDNVFAIQDEIARAVVDELKVTLLGQAPSVRPTDPEAYSLMLQARHHTNQGTPDDLRHAVDLLKQALAIDSEMADAWADLGRAYANMAFGGLVEGEDRFGPARDALRRAIELDPENAAAYSRLGWVETVNYNLAKAAEHYQRAMQLEPGSGVVLGNSAQFLDVLGRSEESMTLHERELVIDPANPNTYSNTSLSAYYRADYQQAIEHSRTSLRLKPGYWSAEYIIGMCLLLEGEFVGAKAAFERENWEELKILGLAMASHSLGDQAGYLLSLERLESHHGEAYPSLVAVAYTWAGELDAGFKWWEKALADKGPFLSGYIHDPLLAGLRNDPRWLAFLRRAGFAPEQLAAIDFRP